MNLLEYGYRIPFAPRWRTTVPPRCRYVGRLTSIQPLPTRLTIRSMGEYGGEWCRRQYQHRRR